MTHGIKNKLRLGDIVSRRLIGPFWHYAVVVKEATLFNEEVVRTVHWLEQKPINQPLSEFSEDKNVKRLDYPSNTPRWKVVENAMNIITFNYNLITNNCEHFFHKAHELPPQSKQVVKSLAAITGMAALIFVAKRGLLKT